MPPPEPSKRKMSQPELDEGFENLGGPHATSGHHFGTKACPPADRNGSDWMQRQNGRRLAGCPCGGVGTSVTTQPVPGWELRDRSPSSLSPTATWLGLPTGLRVTHRVADMSHRQTSPRM